ncbi:MAG TPA: CNNM domain-containing protein [Candidatus Limnocylindria bacterium]|nr:CNNM domain-containing protein [Candidatus Limnocylindria bacterium]
MNSALFIFIAVGLTFSMFLSGMEAGVFALSRVRIRRLVRAGSANAKRLNRYLDEPEEFLWTILAGNTLANFGVASLVVVGSQYWMREHPVLFALGYFTGTILFYALCELLPKMLFRLYPNRLCLWFSRPFQLLHFFLRPVVAVLRWLSAGMLRWSGGKAFVGRLFGTREELRVLMQDSSQDLSSEERGMINRVLDLQHLTVSHVLVPMARSATVSTETLVAEAMILCRERGLSRLPVWRADGKRIVGLFNLKSLLYRADLDPKKKVGDYVKPATFVDADMRLEEAMRHLQRAGQRLAIVLGRDGRELGVVSLQDLLKAIFGEVRL